VSAPSGEQFELSLGNQRAVVVEVGGGLRAYEPGGRAHVDGYALDEMCTSGRGQVLLPWPNRLEDGRYEYDGRQHQLPLTEPSTGNAIHGLVRWAAWNAIEHEPHRVVMHHRLHPQPGYPFSLEVDVEYALSQAGLRVTTTATNVGSEGCPFGCGAHPYLSVGTQTVDTTLLHVPARTVLHSDERGLPTETAPVDGTELDFRHPRPIGSAVLDHAFTDLDRDDDRLARVRLRAPDDTSLTLWMDETYPYVMVFSGDSQPDVARRSLAVEPMTCPPSAFRSGDGVIRLEPGRSTRSAWGIDAST
jgi:aldose 1-epimerase